MAEFIRGTGSALTPTQHSNAIFKNYLKQMFLSSMFGKKGSGKPIIVDDTLSGKPGDTLRYHFIPQDESAGIEGQNATVLGNESDLSEYYFDLTIDQLAKAFRKKGKMTDQRIIWNFREEAKMQLQNWWAQKSEDLLIAALTGGVTGNTITYVTTSTDTTDWVAGAQRCIRASGANGSAAVTAANSDNTAVIAAMANTDTLSYRLIVDASIMARTAGTFKVRPVKVGPNNEEFFILLVHPKAARDLYFSADFQNHALSCVDKGIDKDPIASGSLGVVHNVIVKECERILTTDNGTKYIARNLLLGADAAILGWAQKLDYTEELVDHKRILSVAADEIRGQRKVVFSVSGTDTDAGVVQVLSACA